MINKFGVERRDEGVIVMRMTAGQRLESDDLANLVAHLIILGNMTPDDVAATCQTFAAERARDVEARIKAETEARKTVKAPSLVERASSSLPSNSGAWARMASAAATLQPGASGNGDDND